MRTIFALVGLLLCGNTFAADKGENQPLADEIVIAQIQTNHGLIVLELDAGKAPATVANFVRYAESGFYDGTVFHRVIPGFMIQGGGFEPGMKNKVTEAPVKNEGDNGLENLTGTIAMARTSNPHSATSQFFINVKDNHNLNTPAGGSGRWGYCVFGKVVNGMDTVRKIEQVQTTTAGGYQNVPADNVVIEKVTISKNTKAS